MLDMAPERAREIELSARDRGLTLAVCAAVGVVVGHDRGGGGKESLGEGREARAGLAVLRARRQAEG